MNKERILLTLLALSASGLISIVTYEGYSGKTIIPVAGDVPTIGFGTTANVRVGDTTDPIKALNTALRDINTFEGAIKKCVKVPLSQNEYDAYISLTYNIGAHAFCNSTLVRKLNAGDYEGACSEILKWDYFKGAKLRGLTNRRQKEFEKCQSK